MVVNFRIREISRGTRKLTRTPTLIIKKKKRKSKKKKEICTGRLDQAQAPTLGRPGAGILAPCLPYTVTQGFFSLNISTYFGSNTILFLF
jgi:hypothetical protein